MAIVNANQQPNKVPNNMETTSLDIQQSQNQVPQPSSSLLVPTDYDKMDDGGKSVADYNKQLTPEETEEIKTNGSLNYWKSTLHSNGLFARDEIDYFSQRYRFGIMNPYHQLTNAREYLFFTKPDLNIFPRDPSSGAPSIQMQYYLRHQPEWREYYEKHLGVLKCLQASMPNNPNPFNHLLGNCVSSNLEVPGLSSDIIESANSMYGVNMQYHGSAESSNDNIDFSLEFKDTKLLHVYSFFKAYESYHELSHHGVIEPWIYYSWYHILYDQYSIYKFIVDEDMETIVYYGKMYGVFSKSLPREIFTNTDFGDGINYTVDFHAFQYRDMNPVIISEFNNLSRSYYNSRKYQISIWNEIFDRVDNRPAQAAYIDREYSEIYGHEVFKLRWRGDARE